MLSVRFRLPAFLLALVLLLGSLSSPATAQVQATFNVLAFYSGTWDAAHIDFEKEANQRFPQFGAQNGFTYTATNNWDQLNNLTASQYQAVMFLDDSRHTTAPAKSGAVLTEWAESAIDCGDRAISKRLPATKSPHSTGWPHGGFSPDPPIGIRLSFVSDFEVSL